MLVFRALPFLSCFVATPAIEFGQSPAWLGLATSEFGFALTRHLLREGTNVAVSPISIQGCFSLIYPGATAETATELRHVLHFPKWHSAQDVYHVISATRWPEYDGGGARWGPKRPLLTVSYRVYVDNRRGTRLAAQYEQLLGDRVVLADMTSMETANDINAWVANETHGKIPSIVPVPLPPRSRLVALNTIYLKAQWEHPFHKTSTYSAPFLTKAGSVHLSAAAYMTIVKSFGYLKTTTHQYAYVPLSGGIMVAFRISLCESSTHDEDTFDTEELMRMPGSARFRRLALMIPKFKFDASYNPLNAVLQAMGMTTAFTPEANFSAMSPDHFHIDEVIHKTHIGLDEHGVEASAATSIIMARMADDAMLTFHVPETPILFQLSRPFYFTIYDIGSEVVLFQGKVEEPLPATQSTAPAGSINLEDVSSAFGPTIRESCPSTHEYMHLNEVSFSRTHISMATLCLAAVVVTTVVFVFGLYAMARRWGDRDTLNDDAYIAVD